MEHEEKRYDVVGKSLTEEGLDNFACFLVNNREALKKGERVEEPVDFNLPNKAQLGTPIQAYYARQDIAGEVGGIMYLWNTPESSVPTINFTYERKIQIMVNPDDTLDVAGYAHKYIIYNLAKELILDFGCGVERAKLVLGIAKEEEEKMLAYGSSMYPIGIKMVRS